MTRSFGATKTRSTLPGKRIITSVRWLTAVFPLAETEMARSPTSTSADLRISGTV